MIITYHGLEFIKLQVGDMTIALNAPSKDSKYKKSTFGADIALTTINHPDFNGGEGLSRGDKQPFVISGPGEYEVGGTFIKGLPSQSHYGGNAHINTIYTLTVDSMNICFLGALDNPVLNKETQEALDEIDILFVPIGGDGVLSASDAYKVAVTLEPKIIIPIHYADGDKVLKTFLKEGGSDNGHAEDKLTLKKKDLEGKEGDIMVLRES